MYKNNEEISSQENDKILTAGFKYSLFAGLNYKTKK